MFSLPSIPTDNLYKFCFVSGVILYVLAGFIFHNVEELSLKNDLAMEKIAAEDFRDSVIQVEFKRFDADTVANTEKVNAKVAKQLAIKRTDSIMKTNLAGIKDTSTALTYLQYNIFIIIIGSILILFGGSMWYQAVQKPQDLLLKIQLEMADVELKVATIKLTKLELQERINDAVPTHEVLPESHEDEANG